MATTTTPALTATPATDHPRYLAPGWFTRHVANRAVRRLARLGLSPKGLRELRVRGRRSGDWRTTPVNLLEHRGHRYLVAPRGTTEWVRNLRVAQGGELRVGRRVERFAATELSDVDKPEILRAYLRRWKAEVKIFFDDVDEHASDEQLAELAPGFPVFELRDA
jgi:deazaflavin-dependent oxidoreductase (nitroreductase family)